MYNFFVQPMTDGTRAICVAKLTSIESVPRENDIGVKNFTVFNYLNKMLSYRSETALQGAL